MTALMGSGPQEEGPPPEKPDKKWWALSLLGVLPAVVFGYWMLAGEPSLVPSVTLSSDSAPDREKLGAISQSEEELASSAPDELDRPRLAAPSRSTGDQDPVSTEAEPDQNAIDRFDQNARDFDARLALFEEEQSSIDGAAGDIVREHILSELSPLSADIKVTPECTPSVCVVELTSGGSVGSLIASIASWLRRYPESAIGDPADPDDDEGMRVTFLRNEAPGLKEP